MFYELCGWLATVLFFVSYFPQLVRTYQLKSVDDLSPGMWWVLVGAYTSLWLYGLHLASTAIVVNASLGLSCTILMLVMIRIYRDPRKDHNRQIVRRFLKTAKRRFYAEDEEKQ